MAPTVDDLFAKAEGEIEVLVFLDGYKPDPPLQERDNLILIHSRKPLGMRHAINACASVASGTYLMKCDAHCMFDEGFDVKLQDGLESDWIVVPRRYSLNPEDWCRKPKSPLDYLFLCYPDDPNDFGGASLKGRTWRQHDNAPELREKDIDDLWPDS